MRAVISSSYKTKNRADPDIRMRGQLVNCHLTIIIFISEIRRWNSSAPAPSYPLDYAQNHTKPYSYFDLDVKSVI